MIEEFILAPALVEEILEHARGSYPEEACGIIGGVGNRGMWLCRGHNRARAPRVAFELDVETVLRQLDFESAGLEMVAIYHSHPDGPDVPSALDIERASEGYQNAVYIVCSVPDRDNPALAAYRINNRRASRILLAQAAPTTT